MIKKFKHQQKPNSKAIKITLPLTIVVAVILMTSLYIISYINDVFATSEDTSTSDSQGRTILDSDINEQGPIKSKSNTDIEASKSQLVEPNRVRILSINTEPGNSQIGKGDDFRLVYKIKNYNNYPFSISIPTCIYPDIAGSVIFISKYSEESIIQTSLCQTPNDPVIINPGQQKTFRTSQYQFNPPSYPLSGEWAPITAKIIIYYKDTQSGQTFQTTKSYTFTPGKLNPQQTLSP